jgi:GTP-binding protein EngB required for normal cell division
MSFAQRLQIMYRGKEKEWEMTFTLLTSLRQARLLEQDTVRQIKLDEEIKTAEQKLSEIEQDLSSLENQLSQIKENSGTDESSQIFEDIWNSTLDGSDASASSPEIPYEDIEAIYETLPEEVKAVIEELRQRLERAKGKTFTFLLIGKTGVGKSSTINSLMGANVAPVGHFDPCTTDVTDHETVLHEAIVRVIDTPGLCDAEEEAGNDARYIELMRQKVPYAIDAVLFVSRLDDNRVDASEKRGLRLITEAFGELFWKKSVIVFTHSDKVSNELFEEHLRERTKRIHAELLARQLSKETVYAIPSVAVDNTNTEKINPNGQTWIQQLYLTVLDRIESEDSKDVFVLSTSHMAEKIGVTPLSVMDKLTVTAMAVESGMMGSYLAHLLGVGASTVGTVIGPKGALLTGTLLFTNPVGWAVVLGSTVGGGYLMYRTVKKSKKG